MYKEAKIKCGADYYQTPAWSGMVLAKSSHIALAQL